MRIVRLICGLVIAVGLITIPVYSREQVVVGVSVRIGPPPLPVYVQPVCPEPGYIWASGYWRWEGGQHVWVPGHWEHPHPHMRWVPHHWVHERGGWFLVEGHWERR